MTFHFYSFGSSIIISIIQKYGEWDDYRRQERSYEVPQVSEAQYDKYTPGRYNMTKKYYKG